MKKILDVLKLLSILFLLRPKNNKPAFISAAIDIDEAKPTCVASKFIFCR